MPWLFQISHNCVTECTLQTNILLKLKTYLKAIGDTFSSQYLRNLPPPPQFPHLVGYPDLPMKKALREVGLFTVMIFFQTKKFTACKMKNEKEKTFFYFLMVFNLLKIIHSFESKKHLRT